MQKLVGLRDARMSTFAQSSDRTPRRFLRLALACGAASWLILACSLLAPDDEHYLSGATGSMGGSAGRGAAGGLAHEAGAAGEEALGGAGGGGGAGGASGAAGEANGGEAPTCDADLADCNHDASDGCETDLSSSSENCGGCGAHFACPEDQACAARECVSRTGCSDGTREGFLPVEDWPNLAGCTAQWPRNSLRAPKAGGPCGFGLAICEVPADACGKGWHVCAIPPFGPGEVSSRATAEECAAQPGAFAIAVGDQFCEPCVEGGDGAACCGTGCVQQYGNCIYPGMTAWFGVINSYKNVCGAIESESDDSGVLCCRTP